MKYLTVISKCMLVIIVLAALSLFGYNLYLKYPSGFELRTSKGPQLLTKLNALAEKGVLINPDPYASSTYKPGDPLFEPVLAIQQGRSYDARKPLEKLVSEGDTDAMYWLAEITYALSVNSSRTGAELFIKAAELGNPYAALRLDEDNYECQLMMGLYCDKKWGELGRKILKERADEGDIKAAFALIPHRWEATEEEHKKLENIAFEAIKQNYYVPLVKLIDSYHGLNEEDLLFYKLDPNFESQKELLRKMILIAVNNNYLPSLNTVRLDPKLDTGVKNKITKRYLPILGNSLAGTSAIIELFLTESDYDRKNVIEGAAWSIVADHYENNSKFNPPGNLRIYRYVLTNEINRPDLTESEVEEAKLLAGEYLKISKPTIYIDEIEPRRGGF
ncbi:hypothetical protein L3Q72_08785 [Vibrio sp. JC009]|uniref:hypothetical protein n=1 Tax=Vibrio sp. JC009 TaxID=2912314 RepID=UPI0023AE83C3|nr:hypothetical protein [Vibrio sp. JC009]WED20739.1 hypothetical protein L3Q72_08785 [Vibrio sp. JC009]